MCIRDSNKLFKFIITVIFASTFHITALVAFGAFIFDRIIILLPDLRRRTFKIHKDNQWFNFITTETSDTNQHSNFAFRPAEMKKLNDDLDTSTLSRFLSASQGAHIKYLAGQSNSQVNESYYGTDS